MAEKDIAEKILLSYADVFADCENVLVYRGRQRLQPEELVPAPTESFYYGAVRENHHPGGSGGYTKDDKQEERCRDSHGKGRMRNQFCDVSFYRIKDGQIRAQYILGNETSPRRRQVLRKASYQGGAFRSQLESGKPVYPVVGAVLDWGGRKRRIPLSLKELLTQDGAAEDELGLVDEVKLQVFHMRNLSEEVRGCFTSDMGFVADYLNEGSFENRKNQKIVHVEALCRMMQALTRDGRFMKQVEELIRKQGEGKEITMCEYIDMLEAKGRKEGREEGRKEGRAEEIVESSYELGLTEADTLGRLQKKLNVSLQTAQRYLKRFGREMV